MLEVLRLKKIKVNYVQDMVSKPTPMHDCGTVCFINRKCHSHRSHPPGPARKKQISQHGMQLLSPLSLERSGAGRCWINRGEHIRHHPSVRILIAFNALVGREHRLYFEELEKSELKLINIKLKFQSVTNSALTIGIQKTKWCVLN